MNIVKISGSPAQQMFQYAFYYALLQHDPEARLHVPSEKWINSLASICLDSWRPQPTT